MVEADLRDLVVLHLDAGDRYRDERVVPRDLAVPGIAETLALGEESVADRVTLLSTLADLRREGLVEAADRIVRGLSGERNVYFLTDAGRERAERLRERFRDRTIEVREDGDAEAVALSEIDDYVDDPALPRALSRVTDDGTLYLGESPGERFVDREAALSTLSELIADAADGDARSVLIAGEAGAGKTTLATDRLADLAADRSARVLVGRCQRDAAGPYEPIRAALSDPLAAADDDPFEREGADPEGADAYAAERAAMFDDVAALLDRVARRDGPLAVVIDDLHAAAEPTVELFAALSDRLAGPVVLAGTYRPEDLPDDDPLAALLDGWDRDDRTLIDLDPLATDDVGALLRWLLDARSVPREFVEAVADRTGGNPLFVKELVARLRREGLVDPEHGVYPDDPDVGLPDRIDEAVDHRLSALDDATREALDVGALIGQSIDVETLRAAVEGVDAAALRERIDVLVDARVWERAGDGRLRFVSGLVREAVVERIDDDRRRRLHERIAAGIEATQADDPDRHATAAYHRRRAGDDERAFEHYCAAADRAKAVYAHEVALDHYRRAYDLAAGTLDLPADDDRVVTVLERLAEVYYLLGEYDEADRYYQFVQDRTDDPEQGRRIARVRADMLDARGQYDRALTVCEDAAETYGIDDTHESALLLGRTGAEYSRLGDRDTAEDHYERTLEIGRRIDDDEAIAAGLLDLGSLDLERGEADEGTVDRLEAAVAAAERSGEDRVLARAINNLAMTHAQLGNLDRAEGTYGRVLEIHERMGDVVRLAESRRNLGTIHRQRGDLDAAIEALEAALSDAEAARNRNVAASIHGDLAAIHHARGDLETALEHRRRARDRFEEIGDPRRIARTSVYLADLHLDRGDPDAAERALDAARARLAGVDAPLIAALSKVVAGDLARARGDRAAAADRYEAAIERDEAVETAGAGSAAVYAHVGLAGVALDRGDPDGARSAAETARDRAREVGDPTLVAAARRALGAARRAADEYGAAETALTAALETVRDPATRSVVTECRALLDLGLLDRDRGNRERAREYAREALALATDGGIGRYADECRALAADVGVEGAATADGETDGDGEAATADGETDGDGEAATDDGGTLAADMGDEGASPDEDGA